MKLNAALRQRLRAPAMGLITVLMFAALLSPGAVHAERHAENITVQKSEAKANFPHAITFLLRSESAAVIDQVTLIYGVTTVSCFSSQARHEMEFKPASLVELKWEWDLFRSGDLPPGVEIWWQWEIHAKDGSSLTTEIQKQTIEDTNFQWKTLKSGKIFLHWASGSNTFGQSLLNMAVRGSDRLAKSAGFPFDSEVHLYIYPSAEDMKDVLAHTTEWMGGVAFPEYKIILLGVSTSSLDWAGDAIPHELSHLMMDMRTANCVNQDVPSWLDEGMAEFAQGPVPDDERATIKGMLEKGSLQSLASIAEGFPADSNRANLAYMQSRQVVTFLIETYGQEKLQALLDLLQSGENIEPALRSVYGLDTNGIDQTWRASLGFGTAPEPSFATPTPVEKGTAIPTLALMQIAGQATETPTLAPSPTFTLTATEVLPTAAVSTTVASTETSAPPVVGGAETGATGNLFPWLLAGGAVIVVLLAVLLVLPKIRH